MRFHLIIVLQIGLKFPKAGEGSSAEAMIDLSRYREEELKTVVDNLQWPLVIRLECMSEQGLQQGHSLSVSPPSLSLLAFTVPSPLPIPPQVN